MKHLKNFNEGLIGRSDSDFDPSKDEELRNKISDMITNWVEMKPVPYGDHCIDCGIGEEQFDDVSVNKASSEIIELLKKEGLL